MLSTLSLTASPTVVHMNFHSDHSLPPRSSNFNSSSHRLSKARTEQHTGLQPGTKSGFRSGTLGALSSWIADHSSSGNINTYVSRLNDHPELCAPASLLSGAVPFGSELNSTAGKKGESVDGGLIPVGPGLYRHDDCEQGHQ